MTQMTPEKIVAPKEVTDNKTAKVPCQPFTPPFQAGPCDILFDANTYNIYIYTNIIYICKVIVSITVRLYVYLILYFCRFSYPTSLLSYETCM